MKRTLVCLVALLFATGASHAQQVELTLHPSKRPEPAKKLRLFPELEKRTNADAVPLYIKAVQSLPLNLNTSQIRQWLKTPLDKLPRNEIQSILQQLKPVFQSVEEAAGCKLCNWPAVAPGTMPAYLTEYRSLAYILALKARFEIAQGRYDQAAHTIATGLVAALQCIEALRFYAGANQGNFPDALADIAQVPLPNDPVTQKAFVYSRTGSEAVLKGPAPKGTDAKEAIEYRLTLKK